MVRARDLNNIYLAEQTDSPRLRRQSRLVILPAMKPDWRKVNLTSEENVLVWLQVPQDESGDVSCTCYLTDTVNIYTEDLNTSSIQSRFTEQNPGMETEDFRDFLETLRTALSESHNSTISMTKQIDSCRLDIKWTIEDIQYKWFFQTKVQPHPLLCQVLYLPFIQLSQHLLHTRDSLVQIIQDKDLEIEDYENNGSKLSRKILRTGRFDPERDLKGFDDEKTPDSTVDIVDTPAVREILRTISVKTICEENTEPKGIKRNSQESMISDPSPQVSDNPKSEEENSIKKIKLVKPDLSKIAQSSRFKVTKKKKF